METSLQFKQAAHLCGKDYARGVHVIPDADLQKLSEDKYFHALVKAGLIGDGPVVVVETADHQTKLATWLQKKATDKKAAPHEQPMHQDEEPSEKMEEPVEAVQEPEEVIESIEEAVEQMDEIKDEEAVPAQEIKASSKKPAKKKPSKKKGK